MVAASLRQSSTLKGGGTKMDDGDVYRSAAVVATDDQDRVSSGQSPVTRPKAKMLAQLGSESPVGAELLRLKEGLRNPYRYPDWLQKTRIWVEELNGTIVEVRQNRVFMCWVDAKILLSEEEDMQAAVPCTINVTFRHDKKNKTLRVFSAGE